VSGATDTRPRRLVLSPAELELLHRRSDLPLPRDFRIMVEPGAREAARGELAVAVTSLAKRGVVQPGASGDPESWEVHPSVLANLAVLARPLVLVRTRAWYLATRVRATHALAGSLGAGLVAVGDGVVELSLFGPEHLRRELVRVVPEIPDAPPDRRFDRLVRLDALEQVSAAFDAGWEEQVERLAAELSLDALDVDWVLDLDRRLVGMVQCLVVAPPSDPEGTAGVGQVTWFGTTDGWVGAAPAPGPHGERLVRLTPVDRMDLSAWLAPLIAQALA